MTPLVGVESVRDAARGLRGVAVRTPLLPAPWLREDAGSEVRLKCEGFQPMGAFKLRGAYTMLARLPEAERARGVITYSSGNHAQAVAFAARAFGVPAVIVMPVNAPGIKVEGTRRLGGEVVQEGTTSEERRALAESIRDQRDMIMIPPFDHPDIIAGQGTVALEVLEDWPGVETILVPIGGGGLISGVAAAAKALKPGIRVVGVEPVGAPSMRRSLDAGEPVTLDRVDSIADGLLPTRVGGLTFAHCRDLVDDVVLVDDAAIRAAAARLLISGKLLAEYSGAATTAAVMAAGAARGATVAVVSGANIDPAHVRDFLSAA